MAVIPRRIVARPNREDWSDTEWLTFAEAAALLWPEKGSPLTASSLRTCYKKNALEVVMVNRKLLTNIRAIEAMMKVSTHKVAAKPAAKDSRGR